MAQYGRYVAPPLPTGRIARIICVGFPLSLSFFEVKESAIILVLLEVK